MSQPSPPPAHTGVLLPLHKSWKIATYVAIAMVLLALLGVSITTANPEFATTYWMILVPVYGFLCMWTAWRRSVASGAPDRPAVIRQIWHWVGVMFAMGLDFFIRRTGEESALGAGMTALLLLALGCYLAGVHLERLFVTVGLLLTLALFVVAKADQYMWLVYVIGIGFILVLFTISRFSAPRST